MGAIVAFTSGNAMVLLIIALGIVVVGYCCAYKFVWDGWASARRAFGGGILNNSAASPNSISEPARRRAWMICDVI